MNNWHALATSPSIITQSLPNVETSFQNISFHCWKLHAHLKLTCVVNAVKFRHGWTLSSSVKSFDTQLKWCLWISCISFSVAVKSNPDPMLLRVLNQLGAGFDCGSKVNNHYIINWTKFVIWLHTVIKLWWEWCPIHRCTILYLSIAHRDYFAMGLEVSGLYFISLEFLNLWWTV